jgi:hypothetical protein
MAGSLVRSSGRAGEARPGLHGASPFLLATQDDTWPRTGGYTCPGSHVGADPARSGAAPPSAGDGNPMESGSLAMVLWPPLSAFFSIRFPPPSARFAGVKGGERVF